MTDYEGQFVFLFDGDSLTMISKEQTEELKEKIW